MEQAVYYMLLIINICRRLNIYSGRPPLSLAPHSFWK
jgi:hypothetical protein